MKIKNKYHNYDKHPYKEIPGFEKEAWEGREGIGSELRQAVKAVLEKQKKAVLFLDCYPGVDKEEIFTLIRPLQPAVFIDMDTLAKPEEVMEKEFDDYMTDDRVFGILCHKKLKDFFDPQALESAGKKLRETEGGLCIAAGVGAGFLGQADIYIYCDMTRWEIQLRYRRGMPNWNRSNGQAPSLTKVKCGFFIEWRLADRYKEERYDQFDYVLETEDAGRPKMITGAAFRAGLDALSRQPFRLEPYFDPGVWGGHWMQTIFDLDPDAKNFAWSFDGVPEENAINLKFGDVTVKLPAMDLVLYRPRPLLGERVYARFGAEFPIRFDLLDTMGGGNLSLQVHPLTKYIQDQFGMHYTQDESYYFLDTDEEEETYMYLGVKEHADPAAMERDLKRAERGEIPFPAETYVNKVPVKKHDHISIPAGTVHCSGKNTMVLEISATPYIFTFKLWDWGRVGLDGIPRPIHVDRGMKNIQFDRDTRWIQENLLHQEKTIREEEGIRIERTGLHRLEFIDTYRYSLTKPAEAACEDSVHVINLVEGACAQIQSIDGSFAPFEIHYAETAILPAAIGRYRIVPVSGEIKMLTASVRR